MDFVIIIDLLLNRATHFVPADTEKTKVLHSLDFVNKICSRKRSRKASSNTEQTWLRCPLGNPCGTLKMMRGLVSDTMRMLSTIFERLLRSGNAPMAKENQMFPHIHKEAQNVIKVNPVQSTSPQALEKTFRKSSWKPLLDSWSRGRWLGISSSNWSRWTTPDQPDDCPVWLNYLICELL